jgi:hypothetical protein
MDLEALAAEALTLRASLAAADTQTAGEAEAASALAARLSDAQARLAALDKLIASAERQLAWTVAEAKAKASAGVSVTGGGDRSDDDDEEHDDD